MIYDNALSEMTTPLWEMTTYHDWPLSEMTPYSKGDWPLSQRSVSYHVRQRITSDNHPLSEMTSVIRDDTPYFCVAVSAGDGRGTWRPSGLPSHQGDLQLGGRRESLCHVTCHMTYPVPPDETTTLLQTWVYCSMRSGRECGPKHWVLLSILKNSRRWKPLMIAVILK